MARTKKLARVTFQRSNSVLRYLYTWELVLFVGASKTINIRFIQRKFHKDTSVAIFLAVCCTAVGRSVQEGDRPPC